MQFRPSLVYASVISGVLLSSGVELLGLFHQLKPFSLSAYWFAAALAAFIYYASTAKKNAVFLYLSLRVVLRKENVFLFGVAAILLVTAVIAFVAPPNNWDSLTYHMSRVVHWLQDKTMANYPTNIIRQLTYAPFAEMSVMTLQALSGSDRFADFVQWFSFALCILNASLISKELGGGRNTQVFSAVITASIPAAILQSTSTQNDCVVSLWLTCMIYFIVKLTGEFKITYVIFTGLSLGLAVLTKGTAYIYVLPFLVWLAIWMFRAYGIKKCYSLFLIAVLALALNTGVYMRTYSLNKGILPGVESPGLINRSYSISSISSNILRNLLLNFNSPSRSLNNRIENAVKRAHSLMGINEADPRTTFGDDLFLLSGIPLHEDNAANPLHVLIYLITVMVYFFWASVRNRISKKKCFICYLASSAVALMLFSILLKWQPWNTRLQLPLFILFAPAAAVILSQVRVKRLTEIICTILLVCSLPWVFANKSRPVVGKKSIFRVPRNEQYFVNNPGFMYSFSRAAEEVHALGCRDVGLWTGGDSWEYPVWVLLKSYGTKGLRIEHVNVKNISGEKSFYPLGDFKPCAIIENEVAGPEVAVIGGSLYIKKRRLAFTSVYVPMSVDDVSALKEMLRRQGK